MRNAPNVVALAGALCALVLPGVTSGNADLEKQISNSSNWAMQAGDFYNQR